MTRTDILTIALVGTTLIGGYWWAKRQPEEVPAVAEWVRRLEK